MPLVGLLEFIPQNPFLAARVDVTQEALSTSAPGFQDDRLRSPADIVRMMGETFR
jgi:hypothetical protein